MPRTLTTTTTVELEVTLTGTYAPGYRETPPSYASGGEPAEPDGVDDITVEKVTVSVPYWDHTPGEHSVRRYREIDITKSFDVFGALLEVIDHLSDAETLLLQEVEE